VGGIIKTTANTLTIKTSVTFNLKKTGGASPIAQKYLQPMNEVTTITERLEFFIEIIDHLNEVIFKNIKTTNLSLETAMINLHPLSILRVKGGS
jgi:hypothetical protein